MKLRPLSAVLLCALPVGATLACGGAARADGPDCSDNVISVQVENDIFAPASNTDSHYTSGLRLAFITPLADDCVGLHGGMGFMRDVVAEKLMRDAKQMAVSCLTSEQLDQLAAAAELGTPIDPALVLPTPEAQPIFV